MPLGEACLQRARSAQGPAQALLTLGELGEQMHEDVRDRYAAEHGEPHATRDAAQEAERGSEEVGAGRQEQRAHRRARER